MRKLYLSISLLLYLSIPVLSGGGGIQFSWIDEWFKRTWLVDPMYYIPDRRILWHNLISAEQNFGLAGFRKAESKTLINFSDPSEMTVIHDYIEIPGYQDTISDGISLSIVHKNRLYSTTSRFTWDHWQTDLETGEFLKDSYFIMKENLWQLPGNPIAVTDVYEVPSDGILHVPAETGVLSNDLSLDGSIMTAWLEEGVNTGSLRLNADGSFEYRADRVNANNIYFTYRTVAGGKMSQTGHPKTDC